MLGLFAFFYVLLPLPDVADPGPGSLLGRHPAGHRAPALHYDRLPGAAAADSACGHVDQRHDASARANAGSTLHRLIYAIVLLGIWHYYWQVKADVREPLIYLGIALVLLGWRVWKIRRRVVPADSSFPRKRESSSGAPPASGSPPARG